MGPMNSGLSVRSSIRLIRRFLRIGPLGISYFFHEVGGYLTKKVMKLFFEKKSCHA